MSKKEVNLKKGFKIIGAIVLGLVLLSVIITILYIWVNPPVTPLMLNRKIEKGYTINYDWIDIEKMPQSVIDCAVAAEDNFFLAHNGIDFGAVEKAVDMNRQGKKLHGASTITQQTAKNVFLWQSRTWVRKGFEVYFTFLIETFWSKKRIMEVYLNVIEMGKGIYGVQAAAQHHFHKDAKALTPAQSALIVASFPAPLSRNPKNPSNYLQKRANFISSIAKKIGNIKFDKKSIKAVEERYSRHRAKMKKGKK
ncbi:MAG: monofunctional biosynthetic peptidoglycan transglycosylase [Prevotellaceae bacterium]|jgi:monofunctional biosynthetic peptidoglycan transglycosylase|nr:monofunctional biosynthetic peptidoglycan transglycosylase [Prevotellaceae bacterium]